MIGDRDLDDPPRHELDAVADRRRLGRGEAPGPRRLLLAESTHDRGRPPAVPRRRRAVGRHHRPRLRPRGTRPRTRSTPSAPAACRWSATSCSPRCRTSRLISTRVVLTGRRIVRRQPYKMMKARYHIPRRKPLRRQRRQSRPSPPHLHTSRKTRSTLRPRRPQSFRR